MMALSKLRTEKVRSGSSRCLIDLFSDVAQQQRVSFAAFSSAFAFAAASFFASFSASFAAATAGSTGTSIRTPLRPLK